MNTPDELLADVRTCASETGWRVGQALFNLLYQWRPDLSEQIRNSPCDPFFSASEHDERFVAAMEFLREHWR